MKSNQTVDELEAVLGAAVKSLRLERNINQHTVAERAGISTGALKNLENGRGSTIKTLVSVLKTLGREDWLAALAPVASINPLTHTASATPRQRASAKPDRN